MPIWALLVVLAGTPDVPAKPKPPKVQAAKRDHSQIAASLKAACSDDAKARSAAFLSLSKAGLEKRVPDAEVDDAAPRCTQLLSDAGCKVAVFVCSRLDDVETETKYSSTDRWVGFGTTKDAAIASLPLHLLTRARKSGRDSTDTQCVVVFLDGCHQRAGMVCTTSTETIGVVSSSPPATEVFDLTFK